MVRYIGMDMHREFAQLAVLEDGLLRDEGQIGVTPEALHQWTEALRPDDQVVLEATGNSDAIANLLTPLVGRVVVSNLVAAPASSDATEDAALVLTELVTNAVTAGSTIVQVNLSVHRTRLVITVGDDATGWPRLVTAGVLDERHRGLHLVDTLARARTVHDRADGGKSVTAELTLPAALTGQLPCYSSYLSCRSWAPSRADEWTSHNGSPGVTALAP